ncbi:hypothetical protein [Halalkalibacter akibai]|uniref:Oligopeptide transport permease C-like N-terminal domain-containing protein n=1 Tax=Halalkalibacter akibai (strain ATCC 43226 / DSM 21942 / CIP 109018 / JCM 9157 / 1139) TaxID=1236973 RepID=W4QVD4_HALA3|nr:hypothetical protein [Halalkalibacter akibai]GAE36105.1 hypothetical protein JCM9157_3251 [Halalkalibacter akibai JCM 9157]
MLNIISKRFSAANVAGMILVIGIILVGLLAPSLAPHDPLSIHVANRYIRQLGLIRLAPII